MIRKPVVAGMFYPSDVKELRRTLQQLLPSSASPRPAFGVVAPHAGYVYSGGVAGEVFADVEVPSLVVLLGPNHTGAGMAMAVDANEAWRTPLGDVPVDTALAHRLQAACPQLRADSSAHAGEHSLEVLLPFLQQRRQEVRIVAIALGQGRVEDWLQLGRELELALRQEPEPVLLVASSDMSHYESAADARRHDEQAIEHMLALDGAGLCRTVMAQRISMCGYAPVTVLLAAAEARGNLEARLVRYANSGAASGDYQRVVGYAGMVIR